MEEFRFNSALTNLGFVDLGIVGFYLLERLHHATSIKTVPSQPKP